MTQQADRPVETDTDIVAIVRADHRRLRRILDQMALAADHRPALARLRTELASQAEAEEAVLYPAVADTLADGTRHSHQSTYEHVRIGETLDALDQTGVIERPELLARLAMELRFHMDREEVEWLSVLERQLSPARRRELGKTFLQVRRGGVPRPGAGVMLIRRDSSGTVGGG